METASYISYDAQGNARSFVGPSAVNVFRSAVIASALRLYAKTGMKANRAYTPSAMLKAASEITGQKYKRGEYMKAAEDISAVVQAEKAKITAVSV